MDAGESFMQLAIARAMESLESGGGPFGAVIVKDGKVLAAEPNRVVPTNDPTAHAEITAIRAAAQLLGSFDLSGCEIFSSCEPCPMCLGAIFWARIDRIWYAASREDAAHAGFDDRFIYDQVALIPSERAIPAFQLQPGNAPDPFRRWADLENKTPY